MGRAHEALYILEILAISYAGNHRKIESQRHKTNYTLESRTWQMSETALFLMPLKHGGKCKYNISYKCMMVNLNYLDIFVSILQI